VDGPDPLGLQVPGVPELSPMAALQGGRIVTDEMTDEMTDAERGLRGIIPAPGGNISSNDLDGIAEWIRWAHFRITTLELAARSAQADTERLTEDAASWKRSYLLLENEWSVATKQLAVLEPEMETEQRIVADLIQCIGARGGDCDVLHARVRRFRAGLLDTLDCSPTVRSAIDDAKEGS
jgi:hypothetical protein